jgi:hypothetical protein
VSEAINELVRDGLAVPAKEHRFEQVTHDMGAALIDYSNVADAIETLDGPAAR